jgi:hypothetical protein
MLRGKCVNSNALMLINTLYAAWQVRQQQCIDVDQHDDRMTRSRRSITCVCGRARVAWKQDFRPSIHARSHIVATASKQTNKHGSMSSARVQASAAPYILTKSGVCGGTERLRED